jgi:hypothetical protein
MVPGRSSPEGVGLRFYQISMRDNDPQARVNFIKASERRAHPNGADPSNFAVHML